MYNEGELSNFVFIVKKGEFEQVKILSALAQNNRLKKLSATTLRMQNILSLKLPEIKDIPNKRRLNIYEVRSLIGEEDVLLHKTYQCELRCYSQEGTLLKIQKKDFLKLRKESLSWNRVMEKIAYKDTRNDGKDIGDLPSKEKKKAEDPLKPDPDPLLLTSIEFGVTNSTKRQVQPNQVTKLTRRLRRIS